jgi:ferric iron reductase protein FhuF
MTDADHPAPSSGSVGDLRAVLDRAATLGPFFTIAGARPTDPPGYPAHALYDPDHPALDLLVARVRDRLGGAEPRVAASITHLGYAARLLSPALAALLVDGAVPYLPANQLTVHQQADGSLRLSMPHHCGSLLPGGPDIGAIALDQINTGVFIEHLAPLAARLHRRYRLAPRLLAGNAASAAFGAVRMLPPHLREDGQRLAGMLLTEGPLAGTGVIRQGALTRRSCCLYYRVPGGGTCADCPISGRAA